MLNKLIWAKMVHMIKKLGLFVGVESVKHNGTRFVVVPDKFVMEDNFFFSMWQDGV